MESSSTKAFVDVGQKVFNILQSIQKEQDKTGTVRRNPRSCTVQARCITMRRRSELGMVTQSEGLSQS